MNGAALIARFGQPHTITRRGAVTFDKGRVKAGSTTPVNIVASVQPVPPGRFSELLPEGQNEKGMVEIFSDTELFATDETAKTLGDLLPYKGQTYEIKKVERWDPTDLTHWDAIAVLIQRKP